MEESFFGNSKILLGKKTRRNFLIYMAGSGLTSVAIGYLFPKPSQSREVDLETLCSFFPQNSRCENYLPGVKAQDTKGGVIQANTLLATATPGIPIPVKGLANDSVDYLIVKDGPQIAEYAISPICTHLGCTVEWNTEKNHFICPCHGSQYDSVGRVVHGPAKRSLPLITVVVKQNQVRLVATKPAIDPR
ncbi:Rieske 2Fe-2S domain-containing protein [Nostoc sp. 106C]|uniref:Rieske 2Fe-2S domain-containing protein n=1 Tax=Nostoc sp. 106C TaxID=1932667 RepID=UPI000A390C56|nr:Rieske 2Fe-2S domain-containing protein [Nostoc sp. 106C]OUL22773.1 (2Fe-2S)-binding protein [Nostoc sp. RF31YmG]OUL26817.1 (2Fe-2S)-binding protein [Nostoc sp. 106C]